MKATWKSDEEETGHLMSIEKSGRMTVEPQKRRWWRQSEVASASTPLV